MKGEGFQKMKRKFLSMLVAIMFLFSIMIPAPVALAQGEDDLTDSQIQQIFDYFKARFSGFTENDLRELSDIIDKLDESNQLVSATFDALGTADGLGKRLNSLGVTESTVTSFDSYLRDWKSKNLNNLINEFDSQNLSEGNVSAIKDLNTEFNDTFTTFNNTLHTKFDTKLDAFKMARKIFDDVLLDYVKVSYINNSFSFKITDKSGFKSTINGILEGETFTLFKEGQKINPITDRDVDNIQDILDSYANVVNSKLASTEKDDLKSYMGKLGFTVDTGTSNGGGGSTPGGGSGGGTSGGGTSGGGTTPGEPDITPPAAPGQSVTVTLPSGYLGVSMTDGQAAVSFSDDAIAKLLDLLAKAQDMYKGAPVVVVVNLSGVDSNNIELAIPQGLVKEVFAADASLRINLDSASILLPADAFDIENAEVITLDIKVTPSSTALKDIKVDSSYNTLGNALDITLSVDGKAVNSLNKKAEISFDISGLLTNTDKMGIYYVDRENGKLDFVGGKVDKRDNVIKGWTGHFSTYVLSEYNKTFDDIQNHWAKVYVESMASKHVIGGRTDKLFVPDDKITRAEFTKMLVLTLGKDPVPYKGTFEDVANDAWYAEYVQAAYDNHIIEGKVAGKTFAPDELLSRQDMMTMIGRAISLTETPDTAYMVLNGYKDGSSVSDYARGYVAALVGRGIVSGYEDNTLRPQANSTRAEVAKVIYGIYNY